MSYVYQSFEPGLWTVGFYKPDGTWEPESDHGSPDEAASRVAWLNGGSAQSKDIDYIDLDARRELCSARVTIDGKPARITGARAEFATVRADGGVGVEFAWATVAYVVREKGGRFRS